MSTNRVCSLRKAVHKSDASNGVKKTSLSQDDPPPLSSLLGVQPAYSTATMYILVTVADVVQIPPSEFHKPSMRAIEDFINAKYADKVIHKIGLCIGFHSLISASEGLIGHGTGIVNVNADFRLVVFRPFRGEILRGTITHSNVNGIYLSTDFFEDIIVPSSLLFDNTTWGKDEDGTEAFIWRADNGEGGYNEFFFDRAEKCLLRVEHEEWNDLSPQMQRPQDYENAKSDVYGMRPPPYRIIGSMQLSGLGPTYWWIGDESALEATTDVLDSEIIGMTE